MEVQKSQDIMLLSNAEEFLPVYAGIEKVLDSIPLRGCCLYPGAEKNKSAFAW
jgi:hypothetical protein